MKRLTLTCNSCYNSMITIEKQEFDLNDYLIKETVDDNLVVTSVFTCQCGVNIVATENDITDI